MHADSGLPPRETGIAHRGGYNGAGALKSVIAHYPACALRPGGLAMQTDKWQTEQQPSKPLDSFCNVRPCQSHRPKPSLFSPSSRQSFTQGASQRKREYESDEKSKLLESSGHGRLRFVGNLYTVLTVNHPPSRQLCTCIRGRFILPLLCVEQKQLSA
ncbi:hypothetical protein QQF64_031174 [Cirrhinus molitorella]|uniref:Uncharacterized protein n=1 Tax=Cirrhinus molitorella TaxID=172907 RepID=A0ABR3N5J2_9TELE